MSVGARGGGLGKGLVAARERAARGEGGGLLHLDTNSDDTSNRLYLSMGYTAAGTIPNWAVDADGTPHPTTFYYKVLE